MNNSALSLLFALSAGLGMIVFCLVYELRYVWYLGPLDGAVLRLVEFGALFCIAALWVWRPSVVVVLAIGLAAFAFPPLWREGRSPAWDFGLLPFLALAMGLLVVATVLRKRLTAARVQSDREV